LPPLIFFFFFLFRFHHFSYAIAIFFAYDVAIDAMLPPL